MQICGTHLAFVRPGLKLLWLSDSTIALKFFGIKERLLPMSSQSPFDQFDI